MWSANHLGLSPAALNLLRRIYALGLVNSVKGALPANLLGSSGGAHPDRAEFELKQLSSCGGHKDGEQHQTYMGERRWHEK